MSAAAAPPADWVFKYDEIAFWHPLCTTEMISISPIMFSDIQCTPVFVEGMCTFGYLHLPLTSGIRPCSSLHLCLTQSDILPFQYIHPRSNCKGQIHKLSTLVGLCQRIHLESGMLGIWRNSTSSWSVLRGTEISETFFLLVTGLTSAQAMSFHFWDAIYLRQPPVLLPPRHQESEGICREFSCRIIKSVNLTSWQLAHYIPSLGCHSKPFQLNSVQ